MEVTRQCLEDIERLENAVVRDLDTTPSTVSPAWSRRHFESSSKRSGEGTAYAHPGREIIRLATRDFSSQLDRLVC